MATWKIFVGGGGDDWISGIVKSYEAEYRALNPGYECRYFSWTGRSDLTDLLNGDARGGAVSLVGHSYGGDTAFWCMGAVPVVDLLVSIDPVGRLRRDWASVRAGARQWLNVRAEPSKERRTPDDAIAWLGRKYAMPPAHGDPNAPNYSFRANNTHGDFRGMMRGAAGGVSARRLLGGRSVA